MKNIRENDKETDEFPEDTDNNACADHSSIQHNDVAVRHKTSTPFLGVLVEMVSDGFHRGRDNNSSFFQETGTSIRGMTLSQFLFAV